MKTKQKQTDSRPMYAYEKDGNEIHCIITRDGKVIGEGWGVDHKVARAAAELEAGI